MAARILYHFKMSPFSRRARLALAHKRLASTTELRDARAEPAHMDEMKRLSALSTLPVFVDGTHVLVDSASILHYLDAAYPDAPALFSSDLEGRVRALETIALCDSILNPVVDLGSRYFPLSACEAWVSTVAERRERIDDAFERLVAVAPSLGKDGAWGAGEISLFSMILWFCGLPGRIGQTPAIERILALGVDVPAELLTWAEPFQTREDVLAL